MITVGIAHDVCISSAAIVKDGRVIAAIAEERLNRQKQYKGFPALSLKECLKMARISLQDVSTIAVAWNPLRHLDFPQYRFSNNARMRGEYLYAIPNMLLGHSEYKSDTWIEQTIQGMDAKILYVDHQLTHAANAFYLSGFDEAAVFTADGRGERSTCLWGSADRDGIHTGGEIMFPHSLGLFYGAITQYLGFKPDSDEWKVMALASYESNDNEYYKPMRGMVDVDMGACSFTLDQHYFCFATPEVHEGRLFTPAFVDAFGPARLQDASFDDRHKKIASALQRTFEEVMSELLTAIQARTGKKRLVAAGGCMMNSVYNGRITRATPFEECFISSCPDDSGVSVGAALYAYNRLSPDYQSVWHSHNYWGPSYDDEVVDALEKYRLSYQRLDHPSAAAAELLERGKLIGWYQGSMEFGQRALGNRSILADPRSEDAKDLVNAAVKYRESFRPFAPAILYERVHDYFDAEPDGRVCFMERVYQFREEAAAAVPAVVHVDNTGRLQTVERSQNERFYDLIAEFDKRTGVPIVLNTSFNLNGEPIVCTPTDAIRTFFSCGLDALILGDYLLEK